MALLDPPISRLPEPCLLIGERRLRDTSGGCHQHFYAATGRPTVSVPLAGPREIDEAVAAARQALPAWRSMRGDERRTLLNHIAQQFLAHTDDLSSAQTVESAIPCRFARSFPAAVADHFAYWAGWADKLHGEVLPTWPTAALDYSVVEPYGVVAVIIPWNGPLMSIGQVVAAALATGNSVVLKPPELAPFTSLLAAQLMLKAGLPPGVLNVVAAGPEGADALVRHPGVNKVHFTGSPETARKVVDASRVHLTPLCLELGGKSALLVFGDSDPLAAAQQAVSGAVILSGQGCANGTRVLVDSTVYDRLVRLASGLMRRVSVGDPFQDETMMGPVITSDACNRILAMIKRAGSQGRLVTGGERLQGELSDGYFIAPTLFADVNPTSELAQQEIFGPVVSFMKFESEEQAIELANGTPYALSAYIHTNDLKRAQRVAAALDAGSVFINGQSAPAPSAPFGGNRQSGYGRIGGTAAIREFTRPKNIWVAS